MPERRFPPSWSIEERHYARHPTSIQPLCLWDHPGWTNVFYCSRDCERTLHREPIFISLVAFLANLMGGNASIRTICGARHSRTIDLIDERRVYPLGEAAERRRRLTGDGE